MLDLRKLAIELGWEGALYVVTGITALAFAALDLFPTINFSNDAMLRLTVAALGVLAGAATAQSKRFKDMLDASKPSSVELIDGEDQIFKQSIEARDQLGTKVLKTTGLANRRSFSQSFQSWLHTVDNWLDTGRLTQHLKVIRIADRENLELVSEAYERSRRHGSADVMRFIRPEKTPPLDMMILDDQEVWIGLPVLTGQDGLTFAIRIKNEKIAKTMEIWYQNHLWDSAEPLNDESIERLRQEM